MAKELAEKYYLVANSYEFEPEWYKIVLMDHVEIEHLKDFIHDMVSSQSLSPS